MENPRRVKLLSTMWQAGCKYSGRGARHKSIDQNGMTSLIVRVTKLICVDRRSRKGEAGGQEKVTKAERREQRKKIASVSRKVQVEEFTPGEVEGKRRNGRMQLKIRPNTESVSLYNYHYVDLYFVNRSVVFLSFFFILSHYN
jgi:hypothetical protein